MHFSVIRPQMGSTTSVARPVAFISTKMHTKHRIVAKNFSTDRNDALLSGEWETNWQVQRLTTLKPFTNNFFLYLIN